MFVCQYCGTKYTVEEARKLVTIDHSEERANLLLLARRARNNNDLANMEVYYGKYLLLDPNCWEAAFFHVYAQAMRCDGAGIVEAAGSIKNVLSSTMALIRNMENRKERALAIDCVSHFAANAAWELGERSYSYTIRLMVKNPKVIFYKQIVSLVGILETQENVLKYYFPTERIKIAHIQSVYNQYLTDYRECFDVRFRRTTQKRLTREISYVDNTYCGPDRSKERAGYLMRIILFGTAAAISTFLFVALLIGDSEMAGVFFWAGIGFAIPTTIYLYKMFA